MLSILKKFTETFYRIHTHVFICGVLDSGVFRYMASPLLDLLFRARLLKPAARGQDHSVLKLQVCKNVTCTFLLN